MTYRFAPGRPPAVAAEAMVATSQPRATQAGLSMLERGGNAADAALAAAAMLSVVEPMSTGVGGDAFALVWRDGRLEGLDAAGPAPRAADRLDPVEPLGPRSVTVPGAVAGWVALAERYGRLGLDTCLAPAIDAAEAGFPVTATTAAAWASAGKRSPLWPPTRIPREYQPPPRQGARIRLPELAATLRLVADQGAAGFYRGPVAEAVCAASWLEESDLAAYAERWVQPLTASYRAFEVAELPAPTQGVAALEALALLEGLEPALENQVRCASLALEDAFRRVRDGAEVGDLLERGYIERRRSDEVVLTAEPPGGTVYLCAVDGDRMAVSFVQSLFGRFGSGLVAAGTGVVLQNRGACFELQGGVVPGTRPYHTIIPGMLVRDGRLVGPFGVMGGLIQAQAHLQLVSALVDGALDPQAALDQPRFRVGGGSVHLEQGLWHAAAKLEGLGYTVVLDEDIFVFGGGQAIVADGDALLGGSDSRKDGYAAGF
jgi:gamma-glutamyltranspeptidase/glutathione hydrolase